MTREEQLEKEIKTIEDRIEVLKREPSSRPSAAGGMIQEIWVIKEWEQKDELLGKLKAELHSLKNPGNKEILELVYYGKDHVVETRIKNGIIASGGLLPDYFVGRVASEHHDYVVGRHSKTYQEAEVLEFNMNREKGVTIPFQGSVSMKCRIGDNTYTGTTEFKNRVDNDTYFYFATQNLKFVREENSTRGLGEKEKGLIKYLCGMIYRDKYHKPSTHVNLVEY